MLTAFLIYLYLPGGASALVWSYEWLIVCAWTALGVALFLISPAAKESSAGRLIPEVKQ